jgi:hypothetical protein
VRCDGGEQHLGGPDGEVGAVVLAGPRYQYATPKRRPMCWGRSSSSSTAIA